MTTDELSDRRAKLSAHHDRIAYLEAKCEALQAELDQVLDLVLRSNHTQDEVNEKVNDTFQFIFESEFVDEPQ